MGQIDLPGFGAISDYHDFEASLRHANVSSNLSQLHQFYQRTFMNVRRIEEIDGKTVDGLAFQKQGVDTIIELTNGKQIYFDEKWRGKDWNDILIEEFSVWKRYPFLCDGQKVTDILSASGRKAWNCQFLPYLTAENLGIKPGWVWGAKKTDYITYIFRPSRRVYFLPFPLLQHVWGKYHKDWLNQFGRVIAPNKTYKTINIPIPNKVLFEALYEVADLETKG